MQTVHTNFKDFVPSRNAAIKEAGTVKNGQTIEILFEKESVGGPDQLIFNPVTKFQADCGCTATADRGNSVAVQYTAKLSEAAIEMAKQTGNPALQQVTKGVQVFFADGFSERIIFNALVSE